jgi:hypothetical protein
MLSQGSWGIQTLIYRYFGGMKGLLLRFAEKAISLNFQSLIKKG